ncbi:hypothetical protein J3459_017693 [Metarhizium acridum]|nr:hypothetical protein J3459_017693 [Metarhizium acridum]
MPNGQSRTRDLLRLVQKTCNNMASDDKGTTQGAPVFFCRNSGFLLLFSSVCFISSRFLYFCYAHASPCADNESNQRHEPSTQSSTRTALRDAKLPNSKAKTKSKP